MIFSQSKKNTFGLYIHIPFCVHRCSYCDFFSLTDYKSESFSILIKKLEKEIDEASLWLREKKYSNSLSTIFVGGGTPSLMPIELLVSLFKKIEQSFVLDSLVEITLEANPETIRLDWACKLKENTGVNRISMGVQSFKEKYLNMLERLTTKEGVITAFSFLKRAGFSNINLDFIFGICDQTQEEWAQDLSCAMELNPTHLSTYQLTLSKSHALYKDLPTEDSLIGFYKTTERFLEDFEFYPYEISNYSKENFECKHNLIYWSGGDYLGIGPSASSRFFSEGVFWHKKNHSHLENYFQTAFNEKLFEKTSLEQTQLEAVFLELRKKDGISLSNFEQKYELSFSSSSKLKFLLEDNFLKRISDRLVLTQKGRLVADQIAVELTATTFERATSI